MKRLLKPLFVTLLTLAILETLLRVFDPLGANYVYEGISKTYDENGDWMNEAGNYSFRFFDATILSDHTRLVPDTVPSDCTIATIGDSVTLGWGVDDGETFTNLLARNFPDTHFVNAGVEGYRSDQIIRLRDRTPADGYIWLAISNDPEGEQVDTSPLTHSPNDLFVTVYAKQITMRFIYQPHRGNDWERFWRDFEELEREDTVIYAYDLLEVRDRVNWLDVGLEPVSFIDGHPNPATHKRIAEAMAAGVGDLIGRVCGVETPH